MKDKFYLTSAIPYVNAAPHIGHAQEFVYADVIRRYKQSQGKDTLYLCGADENALKIFQAAEKAGQTPQEFTDAHNQEFLTMAEKLNVPFDVWQRGTDTDHHFPSSQNLWTLCQNAGDIYKKTYSGLYCVGCEMFYTEEELNENGECFEHPGKKLDRVSEENYFFRLSKYQDFLEKLITENTLDIIPDIRKNEALSFIRKGLPDFSISRSKERARGWGIPVPGDPSQIMYVWFDALNIYQTGIGFGWDDEKHKQWWPQDLMVIGKGITRFHAIYWPAILKSAGLALPKQLFIHGYLTVDGQKMSKTIGNVVDPIGLIEKYGTDAVRYYLLREIPSHGDGDYSERRFKEMYNADLANELGNAVSRLAKLSQTSGFSFSPSAYPFAKIRPAVNNFLDMFRFDLALQVIWQRVKELNERINSEQPWNKQGEDLRKSLIGCNAVLYNIAEVLDPFLPDTSGKILEQFRGPAITVQPPLFPRIK